MAEFNFDAGGIRYPVYQGYMTDFIQAQEAGKKSRLEEETLAREKRARELVAQGVSDPSSPMFKELLSANPQAASSALQVGAESRKRQGAAMGFTVPGTPEHAKQMELNPEAAAASTAEYKRRQQEEAQGALAGQLGKAYAPVPLNAPQVPIVTQEKVQGPPTMTYPQPGEQVQVPGAGMGTVLSAVGAQGTVELPATKTPEAQVMAENRDPRWRSQARPLPPEDERTVELPPTAVVPGKETTRAKFGMGDDPELKKWAEERNAELSSDYKEVAKGVEAAAKAGDIAGATKLLERFEAKRGAMQGDLEKMAAAKSEVQKKYIDAAETWTSVFDEKDRKIIWTNKLGEVRTSDMAKELGDYKDPNRYEVKFYQPEKEGEKGRAVIFDRYSKTTETKIIDLPMNVSGKTTSETSVKAALKGAGAQEVLRLHREGADPAYIRAVAYRYGLEPNEVDAIAGPRAKVGDYGDFVGVILRAYSPVKGDVNLFLEGKPTDEGMRALEILKTEANKPEPGKDDPIGHRTWEFNNANYEAVRRAMVGMGALANREMPGREVVSTYNAKGDLQSSLGGNPENPSKPTEKPQGSMRPKK